MAKDFHNGRRNMVYMTNVVSTPEEKEAARRYLARAGAEDLMDMLGLAEEETVPA